MKQLYKTYMLTKEMILTAAGGADFPITEQEYISPGSSGFNFDTQERLTPVQNQFTTNRPRL